MKHNVHTRSTKKGLGRGLLAVADLLATGAVLLVFALFHHVLPREIGPIGYTAQAAIPTATAPAAAPAPSDAVIVPGVAVSASGQAPASEEPSALPAQTPAPAAAPGDFSATFPEEDTGVNALYSYQGEDMKIAITRVQENGVTYFVADVYVRNLEAFHTAFAKGRYGVGIYEYPWDIADGVQATFAVTGDYASARNRGIVIRNGVLYRDSINSDVCLIFSDGVMETYHGDTFDLNGLGDREIWQAWGFGPLLLENGQPLDTFDSTIAGRQPRNSIGYYAPGHYCFVTVDGRQSGYSHGMKLSELSALYASLGCKTAFNLDGGATAVMIFQGQVVNKPYKGGRQSGDIIWF